MNIFSALLFVAKSGAGTGDKQVVTGKHNRKLDFNTFLLDSLIKEQGKISDFSRSQLKTFRRFLNTYLFHLPVEVFLSGKQLNGIVQNKKIKNENVLKNFKYEFSGQEVFLKSLVPKSKVLSEKRVALITSGREKIFILKPIFKKKLLVHSNGKKGVSGSREKFYKPLKKMFAGKCKLGAIKKEGERLFKLAENQGIHRGAPLETAQIFGVAPEQMVNQHLYVKTGGEKEDGHAFKKRGEVVSFNSTVSDRLKLNRTLKEFKIKSARKGNSPSSEVENGNLEHSSVLKKPDNGFKVPKKNQDVIYNKRNRIKIGLSDTKLSNFTLNEKSDYKNNVGFQGDTKVNNTDYSFKFSLNGRLQSKLLTEFNVKPESFFISTSHISLPHKVQAGFPYRKGNLKDKNSLFSSKFNGKFRIIKDAEASFPPGNFPALKRAVVDRSAPPPVHLFSATVERPQPLLSDTSSQFQHHSHQNKNSIQTDGLFSGVSTVTLQDQLSSGSTGKENNFSNELNHSSLFQVFKKDTGFQLSYVDKNLKLLATLRGNVLNLNLNVLSSLHIDPSTLKDLTAVIEDSGFVPGKITLKQKKERYVLFREKASDELELKV